MSEQPNSRGRVISLIVLLLAAAGIVVWQQTRNPAPLPDATAEKANRLTQKMAELEDQRRANEAPLPPARAQPGLTSMRGSGETGED